MVKLHLGLVSTVNGKNGARQQADNRSCVLKNISINVVELHTTLKAITSEKVLLASVRLKPGCSFIHLVTNWLYREEVIAFQNLDTHFFAEVYLG